MNRPAGQTIRSTIKPGIRRTRGNAFAAWWKSQTWLDQPAERASTAVDALLGKLPNGRMAADFLHGVWLGHPLHPAFTDIPLGAWTVAAVLDSTPNSRTATKGAEAAVGIGILGAVGAAATGIIDAKHLDTDRRRIASGHALLNTVALTLYIGSFICRRRGKGPMKLTGMLGLMAASASSYLGGHLISEERVGVRHESSAGAPEDWKPVAQSSELSHGSAQRVEVDGYEILLVRDSECVFAVADTCTHLGCSLAEGEVEALAVTCPCHGSVFSVADGRVVHGPATSALDVFEVREVDGVVQVRRATE